MGSSTESVRQDVAAAVTALAGRVTEALADVRGTAHVVAPFVEISEDKVAALGAVRVLGADALAPALLAGTPPAEADTDVMAEAARCFPLAGNGEVLAWHDWATAEAVARQQHPPGRAPRPEWTVPEPASDPDQSSGPDWREWSVALSQLAALALPGLDGPVHQAARRHAMVLARGACWAAMRRDYPLAARLARWLAFLRAGGLPPGEAPLDPAPLLDHLLLVGGVEARTVLDARIGKRLLAGDRP